METNQPTKPVKDDLAEITSKKPMNWRDIIFILFAGLFLGSLFYSFEVNRVQSNKLATIDAGQLSVLQHVDSARQLILVLRSENKAFHDNIVKLVQERKDLQIIQQQISRSYDDIYNQIQNASNDSTQLVIYDSLIARNRRYKLERE